MKRAAVIGWPIEHSRSPLIHNHWLNEHNIDGRYEKIAVKPEAAAEFMLSLSNTGLAGCNVTVSLKEIAFNTARIKHPSAEAVGAANTLWLDDMGRLCAMNTDTYGFMTNLEQSAPDWLSDVERPVTILGAGGAARAIVYGFKQAGMKHIHIYNRTLERARELANLFGDGVTAHDWNDRATAPRNSAVIVNTTTIGMHDNGSLDIGFESAHPGCVVCDIVYVPLLTGFLKAAQSKRLRTVDGLGMLLHQAVPGFEKWFAVRPQVTPQLRDIVLKNL